MADTRFQCDLDPNVILPTLEWSRAMCLCNVNGRAADYADERADNVAVL